MAAARHNYDSSLDKTATKQTEKTLQTIPGYWTNCVAAPVCAWRGWIGGGVIEFPVSLLRAWLRLVFCAERLCYIDFGRGQVIYDGYLS